MSKKQLEFKSDFTKHNDLSNLYFSNFENTQRKDIKAQDIEDYSKHLLGMVDSIYEKCKDKISKEQNESFINARSDFMKGYIDRPFTKDEANIIYDNRVQNKISKTK